MKLLRSLWAIRIAIVAFAVLGVTLCFPVSILLIIFCRVLGITFHFIWAILLAVVFDVIFLLMYIDIEIARGRNR